MRAARLIKMVLLLQSGRSMTAARLAGELGVSERTVARDAQALSEAGVPVYANRGRNGGYGLVSGYRTGLTGLGRDEAEALFLSGVPGALRDLGLADAASAARLKVSAALTPTLRDVPGTVARRFHLDAPGWYHEPSTPAWLPVFADAVWRDRVVSARYARPGAPSEQDGGEREFEPHGLVLKAGVWYVCARTRPEGPFRVYRVERFTSATALKRRFSRDSSLDLSGFWTAHAAEFARSLLQHEVTVRLTEQGAARLPHVTDRAVAEAALSAAGAPDAEDRVTVLLPMETEDVAYGQLLGLGPEAEVLAPEALRERFTVAARDLCALYG